MNTQMPLQVGDSFMINGFGHPRGHVYTVAAIREPRKCEGKDPVFDCVEVTKSGRECETLYSLPDSTLVKYNKNKCVTLLGAEQV